MWVSDWLMAIFDPAPGQGCQADWHWQRLCYLYRRRSGFGRWQVEHVMDTQPGGFLISHVPKALGCAKRPTNFQGHVLVTRHIPTAISGALENIQITPSSLNQCIRISLNRSGQKKQEGNTQHYTYRQLIRLPKSQRQSMQSMLILIKVFRHQSNPF